MLEIVPLEKSPTKAEVKAIIDHLVKTDKISWTKHSKARMNERDIAIPEVINCLQKGVVMDEPYQIYDHGGGYRVTLEKRTAGRHLRVVATLKYTQRILVITAIWV